ncbi:MAG: helix-turn-helix transcriptional regulator [Ruminococcaceae bacterium]|nr:helix-turn-helix transcriptional regulator [Oscillospiraceae bacterium]
MENGICKTIVKYRKAAGMSQQKLGALVGVSPQAISRWENGGMPDVASMPKLAQALGCSLDDLYGVTTSVPTNLLEQITQELRHLPGEERLKKGIDIAWHVLKVLVSAEFPGSKSFQHNFDMLGSIENAPPEVCIRTNTPASSSIPSATICNALTNHAIMQASTAPDFKYVLLMSDPVDRYQSVFRNMDAYRLFFSLLCKPGRLEIILMGLSLPPGRFFTREYVCANLEIPEALAQEALEDLHKHQLLSGQVVQDTTTEKWMYKVFVDPSLIYFFHFASLLMREGEGYYSMNTSARTEPLVNYNPSEEASLRGWEPTNAKNKTAAHTELHHNHKPQV